MKLAIAGDSAGEALARQLADYLKTRYDVDEISHPVQGTEELYANLSDRVGSAVMAGATGTGFTVSEAGPLTTVPTLFVTDTV